MTVPEGIGVREGSSVSVGTIIVPTDVGTRVGVIDGTTVGTPVGTPVGVLLGTTVGTPVGTPVGVLVGTVVGTLVGVRVGVLVGTDVEVLVGVAVLAVGWSFGSPGKVSARSSWILVKPSPSESMLSIAVRAAALAPLFRKACP